MARRQHITLMFAAAVVALVTLSFLMSSGARGSYPPTSPMSGGSTTTQDGVHTGSADFGLSSSILTGGAIAPKLGNETAKAELGRAAWKVLHTMMARFPEQPAADDSMALKTYIQLFARLYPCGECAAHFQKLLKKYPPQTSSRNAAAGWACFVHNEVNQRLKKPIFDCNNIGDFYDCGCADKDDGKTKGTVKGTGKDKDKDKAEGKDGQAGSPDLKEVKGRGAEFDLETEGLSIGK